MIDHEYFAISFVMLSPLNMHLFYPLHLMQIHFATDALMQHSSGIRDVNLIFTLYCTKFFLSKSDQLQGLSSTGQIRISKCYIFTNAISKIGNLLTF